MRKQSKKTIKRNLDKEWKKLVKERDLYKCQMCLSVGIDKILEIKKLNSHHIITRKFSITRHDVMNGITLCQYHHHFSSESPHQNAILFSLWLEKNKPEQFRYIVDVLKKNFNILKEK